ncbi:MAG: T9SS type A sorting domain-containing protein [Ignavibacteriaceae bacterium]|nr:T9SS type A sorting domain-containing protein [Ignavibacteriaceae bacterium]
MKNLLFLSFFLLFAPFMLYAQSTSNTYLETFNNGGNIGWSFTTAEADISVENGELKFVSSSDDFVYLFPPIDASKDDFSFKIKPGSVISGVEGGGFGRMGFKSLIAILISDPLFSDSITVVYTDNIQSFSEPNFITLISYPIPANVNSLQLDVSRSGNNLIINAYVNDVSFYSGQLDNADPGLFEGNMIMFLDPDDGPGLKEWSLDEAEIHYNPMIELPGYFSDSFDNSNSPWLRFGDFDNIGQSISINNGRLNFNYNGLSETALFVMPPVGTVTDFTIEIEGSGGPTHNAPFSFSRFWDYKNYTTFLLGYDTLYFGYSDNTYEPTIINFAAINPLATTKLKFSIEGHSPATYKAWANDQLIMNSSINITSEKLRTGHLALGYDRGNTMDAYLDYANITYGQYVSALDEQNSTTPNEFLLYPNYPNPFNPVTTIKYTIPKGVGGQWSMVNLKVYDVLGNEIAVLVNEQKTPGAYEVNFDATHLSSGVYFYQLKAGSFNAVRKLVLTK